MIVLWYTNFAVNGAVRIARFQGVAWSGRYPVAGRPQSSFRFPEIAQGYRLRSRAYKLADAVRGFREAAHTR